MSAYLVRRLAALVPLFLVVSFAVFALIRTAPGDPVRAVMGERATQESIAAFREEWHLDDPLVVQYGVYLGGVVTEWDFGRSYRKEGKEIADEISRRLPATVELTFAAMGIAILGGVLLGVISAVFRGSWIDLAGMGVALAGVSIPVFWLGLILMLWLGPFLAAGGNLSEAAELDRVTGFLLVDTLLARNFGLFLDALRHLVLPAIALATIPLAMIARITRNSTIETLGQDYVRTARAKGLDDETVVMRHALRNALVPIVTMIGLQFGMLLGGAVLTETVFAWPGMGTFLFDAIDNLDYPEITAGVIVLLGIFAAVNLAVDVLYAFLDPRIRYG